MIIKISLLYSGYIKYFIGNINNILEENHIEPVYPRFYDKYDNLYLMDKNSIEIYNFIKEIEE